MTHIGRARQSFAGQVANLTRNRRLLVVCLGAFVLSVGMGLSNPVVSLYARSFGVSTSWVGVYITVFALGRIMVTLPAGRAADRWGRRSLMLLGPLVIAVASVAEARAGSFATLTIFRLLHGVGSALAMSPAYLMVADLSAPDERGRSTSLFHTALLGGLTLGPLLGGIIADRYGLAAPFLGTAAVSVVVGPGLWLYFRDSRPAHTKAGQLADSGSPPAASMAPRQAGHDRAFWLAALVGFIIFAARAGARDTILPLRGNQDLGLPAAALGVMFTALAGMNMLAVPVSGWASDRLGRKPTILAGLLIMTAAMLLLALAGTQAWFLGGALGLGLGKGLAEPASMVYLTDITPVGRYGASYGLYLTLRDVGLLLGPVVLGLIADRSNLQLPLVLTGLAVLGVVAVFAALAQETLARPVARAVPGPGD